MKSPATYERVSGCLGDQKESRGFSLALSFLRNERQMAPFRLLFQPSLTPPYFKYFLKHHCFNATKEELDHKQG